MQTQNPHQPHDKLFKKAFSDHPSAAALLKSQLPTELVSDMDWENLRLVSGNFIDEHFRSSASDLLYGVPFKKGGASLYIILEHQRKEDPHLGIRLLGYMTRLWEQLRLEHPGLAFLPPIISFVVSQSSRPWKTSLSFHDSIGIPNAHKNFLKQRCPDFKFRECKDLSVKVRTK